MGKAAESGGENGSLKMDGSRSVYLIILGYTMRWLHREIHQKYE
jgi:hypothetical protein